jgi:hypothetical protein
MSRFKTFAVRVPATIEVHILALSRDDAAKRLMTENHRLSWDSKTIIRADRLSEIEVVELPEGEHNSRSAA